MTMASGWGPNPSSTEVGEVKSFRFAPTSGNWLPLDGATYNVDDYPVLGALYGGTPGGTFDVDDWRGLAIYAADASNPAGTVTGSNTRDLSHSHGGVTGDSGASAVSGLLPLLASAAPPSHTHTVSADLTTPVDIRPARAYAGVYIRALP